MFTHNQIPNLDLVPSCKVVATKCISVGEWCFFKYNGTNNPGIDDNQIICLGVILAFKFTHGKSEKEKCFKGNTVSLGDFNSPNDLEALSSWYQINDTARFIPTEKENHRFLSLNNYIATVLIKPLIDPDTKTLYFNATDFQKMDKAILKLI